VSAEQAEARGTVRVPQAVVTARAHGCADDSTSQHDGKKRSLVLPVKRVYFEQIASGEKQVEYRRCAAHWLNRLENRHYDEVVITLGYPKKDDTSRRIRFAYAGFRTTVITHEHFGPDAVLVLAIPLLDRVV
jgi:hypothetical protein